MSKMIKSNQDITNHDPANTLVVCGKKHFNLKALLCLATTATYCYRPESSEIKMKIAVD